MSQGSNLIQVKDIYKEFVNDEVVTKVLFDISFKIDQGEFVAIMGPSGSGKSTLMHILSFLDRPTSGSYIFEGKDTKKFDDDKLAEFRNLKLGFVFQAFNLLPRTSVFENVMLPLEYAKVKRVEKVERVKRAVESVGLTHRINNLSNQLSGGEKQRVAIARALVNNPEIIFADEPTGNLDSRSGQQVMEILTDLNNQGKTIILVTHEQYTAECARRILKMKDGRVESDTIVNNRKDVKNGLVK